MRTPAISHRHQPHAAPGALRCLVPLMAALTAGATALAQTPVPPADSPTPVLRQIMVDLGRQMQSVSAALSQEDWATIAALAPRIGKHPEPPPAEKVRILTALGANAGRFREADQRSHQAAEAMGAAAARGDGEAVIAAYAQVHSACLACHQAFRRPLREALMAQPVAPAVPR